MPAPPPKPAIKIKCRPAKLSDLDALFALEHEVFTTDQLSRRSLHHHIVSPTADLIVAEHEGQLVGYMLVVYNSRHSIARVYTFAVSPRMGGRGIGTMLVNEAVKASRKRKCDRLRVEAHERNAAAAATYLKSGFHQFALVPDYYGDGGAALRFERAI